MSFCICGHDEREHESDEIAHAIDWCNAADCPCQRFADQDQVSLEFQDDEPEPDLDDMADPFPEDLYL